MPGGHEIETHSRINIGQNFKEKVRSPDHLFKVWILHQLICEYKYLYSFRNTYFSLLLITVPLCTTYQNCSRNKTNNNNLYTSIKVSTIKF